MTYFQNIMRNIIRSRLVNIEAFVGIFFNVLRMTICVLFRDIFIWANIDWIWNELDNSGWIERRVISYFLKMSGFWWVFLVIGVRTQQTLQKLDKVDVFERKNYSKELWLPIFSYGLLIPRCIIKNTFQAKMKSRRFNAQLLSQSIVP